jgi:ABC-type dipeptide/oligopeptide/nickel transport system ATPase component
MAGKLPILQIKNLSVAFNSHEGRAIAVDNLSFSLSEGETLGIVGESGNGCTFPGFAILSMAIGANFVGDGVRDMLDPKLRKEFH